MFLTPALWEELVRLLVRSTKGWWSLRRFGRLLGALGLRWTPCPRADVGRSRAEVGRSRAEVGRSRERREGRRREGRCFPIAPMLERY